VSTVLLSINGKMQSSAQPRREGRGVEKRELYQQRQFHSDIRYKSAPFVRFLAEVTRLARSPNVPILLEGESGTGKSVIARHVHNCSPRASASFHAVNVGAMDDALAGSELFGHIPGAFTDARQTRTGHFATANGGTIFLDEIGKAGRSVQRKLLHVIESGEMHPVGSDRSIRVDVRVVAASNRPIEELVAEGEFLPDLYARLAVFRVRLPALRERRADIPMLVDDAIQTHHAACGYEREPDVSPELMNALRRAPWPHNLRELDSTVHRILLDAEGASTLSLDHCDSCLSYLRELGGLSSSPTEAAIVDAIARSGSVTQAARELGIDRGTLYRRRRKATT
jgi:two-component system NtrC family response regulator